MAGLSSIFNRVSKPEPNNPLNPKFEPNIRLKPIKSPSIKLSPVLKPEPSIKLNPVVKEPSTRLSNFPTITLLKNNAVVPVRQTPTIPVNPLGFPNVTQLPPVNPLTNTPPLGSIFDPSRLTIDPKTGLPVTPDFTRGSDIVGQITQLISDHQVDLITGVIGVGMVVLAVAQIAKPI